MSEDYKNISEEEWQKRLTPEQYHVCREKGTERPGTGAYNDHSEPGTYACVCCGQELFKSDTKFNAGCGWPSFYAPLLEGNVAFHEDYSHNMQRIEVTCSHCDAHLGHVFDDGPPPTGKRFCINSVSLKFIG